MLEKTTKQDQTSPSIALDKQESSNKKHLNLEEILRYLENDAKIAKSINSFEERPEQKQLLEMIVNSFNNNCHSIFEGETGIGKSIAYLLPSIFYSIKNKCRVIVSTNTINLQQQLVEKDLPMLASVLPFKFKFSLVKGRNNFLCTRRLKDALATNNQDFLLETQELDSFQQIVAWAKTTSDGSLSDLDWIPHTSLWEKICSDRDSCLDYSCPEHETCFFYRSRRRAFESDILVVNHHLLFSDLSLRASTNDYTQAAILPPCEAIIFDEAHNLEETATNHFGFKTTFLGIQRLLSKIYNKKGRHELGALEKLYSLLSFGYTEIPPEDRANLLTEISDTIKPLIKEATELNKNFFDTLVEYYADSAVSHEQRMRINARIASSDNFTFLSNLAFKFRDCAKKLSSVLNKTLKQTQNFLDPDDKDYEYFELPLKELASYSNRLKEIVEAFKLMFDLEHNNRDTYVHFFSIFMHNEIAFPGFQSLPIIVSQHMLDNCFTKFPVTVMLSGTLSTANNFNFIKQRLGLDSKEITSTVLEGRFASPFDYAKQVKLFVPTDLPEPSSPYFLSDVVSPLLSIILSSNGGTLVLFTSYTHLQHFYTNISPLLSQLDINCMMQGEMERHYLIEVFKEDPNSVLFATDSFWEGIDVPGNSLRNLVIMRLPFATPNDPVLEARNEIIKSQGGNPFYDYQLPIAALKLKQGFGRLIRNKNDKGTVWILDNRIVTKQYGRYFVNSLPKAPILKGNNKKLLEVADEFFSS